MDLALWYSCLEAGRHTGGEIIEINLNSRGRWTFGWSWDRILSSKKSELDWVPLTLGKTEGVEWSEGEDDTVMVFTFSSDLGRKRSQRENDRQSQKRWERGERWWWDKGTWWRIASINHYRPITLNQRISLFSVLVKRISVITAPCGIATQSNLINALEKGLGEYQCWLHLFEEKKPPGIFQAESHREVRKGVRWEMRWSEED